MISKKYCDELNGILRQTGIGVKIEYSGVRLMPDVSRNACAECIFETDKGASGCQFRYSCMAHMRKDNRSVIFASPKR